MTVILEAKNLTKSYGGVRVVDDLSVSLVEGEAFSETWADKFAKVFVVDGHPS